jgi:CubicO group peptidase (beta-lactamase class C family)
MKMHYVLVAVIATCLLSSQSVQADEPSAFGSGFDVQDFYGPFTLEEITPKNMQKWPYYKHVSTHWDEYALHGTDKVAPSKNPAKLKVAEDRLDLNTEYKDGKSYIDSFVETQVKGFVVIKDNQVLAEHYDNGFNLGDTNLLQSAAKTFAGMITHKLIEKGLLDPKAKVTTYLKDFGGTSIGAATVQQVLDHTSGMPTLLDFHTPGATGQLFEVEQGLQAGKPKGHRNTIKATKATKKPGEAWQYCDMNTDTLALLAEEVCGKKFSELLSELFDEFGANDEGSIAKSSDETFAPSYGISISARDYALFHQWIAQGKAPKSYYASVTDPSKTKFGENKLSSSTFPGVRYGSQSYYIAEDDVIYSSGSYGQQGYSDLKTGVAVVFLSDWAVNWEVAKGNDNRYRAITIINHLRASTPNFLRINEGGD